jgi:hypothetical protein
MIQRFSKKNVNSLQKRRKFKLLYIGLLNKNLIKALKVRQTVKDLKSCQNIPEHDTLNFSQLKWKPEIAFKTLDIPPAH